MIACLKSEPRVLLVYKRSPLLSIKGLPPGSASVRSFHRNHLNHYASLRQVENVLRKYRIRFHKRARSRSIDYRAYDLIITVGGDGTFFEAARQIGVTQFILGVNSDPTWSVGQFCACDAKGFEKVLSKVCEHKARFSQVHRLRVHTAGCRVVEALNDILICHANPAAMSRYMIQCGAICEEHRNSGIWFSTAAGSTGAIFSAGGRRMPLASRKIQYQPRELYYTKGVSYRLKGGLTSQKVVVTSHMTHGCLFIDGAHIKLPFGYGHRAVICPSPNYIQLIHA